MPSHLGSVTSSAPPRGSAMSEPSSPVVIERAQDMSRWAENLHQKGIRIGFVPTMGALHAGHLALVRLAQEMADVAVVSIFVNPTQFGEGEDFAAYPRDRESDLAVLAAERVDAVFMPGVEEIYPEGEQGVTVSVGPAGTVLEGAHRPRHFDGVVAVVSRLFDIVAPDSAVFGKKDAQQLAVIRHLGKAKYPGVEIVAGEVVREEDGLALSSRNRYLTADERVLAAKFPAGLSRAAESLRRKQGSVEDVLSDARSELTIIEGVELDYVELVDAKTFSPVNEWKQADCVLVGAVWINTTRLIDAVWFDTDGRKPAQ